ncbi:putative cytoplasmic protein [Zymoseptoria brevis]|uniref:Putative cytoplasmic protein n=1 Tax=Zymoseptoria brevis TaxID=1047168 RepID=A0A0F4G5G6_9PEZI|nr:putative cytoplasmic protein [Zymoseptoria brevis]
MTTRTIPSSAEPSKIDDSPIAKQEPSPSPSNASSPPLFPTPALNSTSLRMSYAIARGEVGVLSFEPYKSILLPHWRFRTVPIAKKSSQTLKSAFDHYVRSEDLVGADMARKFIQMGMTRARRYANYKGGRKYEKSEKELEAEGKVKADRVRKEKSAGHEGREEKAAASEVFKVVWRKCIEDEGYVRSKEMWKKEKKAWERGGGTVGEKIESGVKKEEEREMKDSIKVEEDDDD